MTVCLNCKCLPDNHKKESDKDIFDIVMRMIEASYLSIPLNGSSKTKERRRQIPGWKKNVGT